MKSKLKGVLGLGFALILVASLMLFAVPVAAGPYEDPVPIPSNAWLDFAPTQGVYGLWFYSPTITQVGPMARAINGDIFAYVANASSDVDGVYGPVPAVPATPDNPFAPIGPADDAQEHDIFKSPDNGRTWSVSSIPNYYANTNTFKAGGAVVDMVCSEVSEDVLYLTDGNYVFKSINGAASFSLVVPDDLEKKLCGACGTEIQGEPITCIDLAYDGTGLPITLIGTKYVTGHVQEDGDPAVGTVLWISDETFSAEWTDLQVECFGCCPETITAEVIDVTIDDQNTYSTGLAGSPLMFPPLMPGSITITDDSGGPYEVFTDPDGDGVLTGSHGGSGSINYATGAWSITYEATIDIDAGDNILATYDSCYGCYDVYAVAAAPGFANVPKVYAVVTAPLFTLTFAPATAATVELRGGDNTADGADIFFDSRGVTGLGGGNVTDNTTGTFALAASNGTGTITFTPGTAGTVFLKVTDETVSWRVSDGAATFCGGTRVISTLTVCSWAQVTELMWDCRWSHTIQHATRIMFPSYYATQPTLFVGTVAEEEDYWGEGGDVYRVADTIPPSGCIDLNVQGFVTGCAGIRHANICSLDIDEADGLLAGAWDEYQLQSPTRVYYAADGGWTWVPSKKDPTGLDRTYVLFGSALAGTHGCDCGFSMSCGDNIGEYFNQISLISMDIDQVLDLTHSPDYVLESNLLFALVQDQESCAPGGELRSLLRWDGTYWERVHSSRYFFIQPLQADCEFINFPLYDWVEVSPDANSTSVVYMANTEFYMARTLDWGCSWAQLTYPCFDRASISAWIVVDEDSVLAAGAGDFAGHIYRTTNHGAQPWDDFYIKNTAGDLACDGVDFDLSLPRAADSDVLFGDACGQVYISFDLGETWAEIQDAVSHVFAGATDQTYVVFDPGYAVADDPGEKVVYAAAGDDIGRCVVDLTAALPFKQDWQYLNPGSGDCVPCTLCVASGIDAAGDTVLYVADGGGEAGTSYTTVSGTIEVDCLPSLTAGCVDCNRDLVLSAEHVFPAGVTEVFTDGEPVVVSSWNLVCIAECVYTEGEPDVYECYCKIEGRIWLTGAISGAYGYIIISTTEAAESVCGDPTPVDDEALGASAEDDTTYSGTLDYFPICAGSLEITESDTGEVFTDLGTGVLDGDADGTGTIDYDTGEWAITLGAAPEDPGAITADYAYVACAGPGNAYVVNSFLTADVPTAGSYCAPGVWRTVDALALINEAKGWNYVEWEFLDEGIPPTDVPANLWHPPATEPIGGPITYGAFTVNPDDLWLTWGSNVLWALENGESLDQMSPDEIWIWDDPLAQPVIQVAPADGALLATTTTATLEWEALDGAEYYEYMIYSYCETCPDNKVVFGTFTSLLSQTCVVVEGLTPGMTYYWKVRAACDSPKISKWSDLRSFDTALGAVPYLCSPWCGQDDVTISTAFSWDAVFGATSYDIEIATDEAFSNVVSSGTTTVNAWTPAAPLDYSTVYYWRVRAVKDGVLSAWAVCIFTTAAEPVEPPEAEPPVVVEQTEITPVWIWVIIGIGGALTIAVVILIVTTRRVP
jgi:hypothetical protein